MYDMYMLAQSVKGLKEYNLLFPLMLAFGVFSAENIEALSEISVFIHKRFNHKSTVF